jgi:hypothetical protein
MGINSQIGDTHSPMFLQGTEFSNFGTVNSISNKLNTVKEKTAP